MKFDNTKLRLLKSSPYKFKKIHVDTLARFLTIDLGPINSINNILKGISEKEALNQTVKDLAQSVFELNKQMVNLSKTKIELLQIV